MYSPATLPARACPVVHDHTLRAASVVVAAAFSALLATGAWQTNGSWSSLGFSRPPSAEEGKKRSSLSFILMAHGSKSSPRVLRTWEASGPGSIPLSHAAQVLGPSPAGYLEGHLPGPAPRDHGRSLLVFIFASAARRDPHTGRPPVLHHRVGRLRQPSTCSTSHGRRPLALRSASSSPSCGSTPAQMSASVPLARKAQNDHGHRHDRTGCVWPEFLMLLFLASPLLDLVVCSSTGWGFELYYAAIFKTPASRFLYPQLGHRYSCGSPWSPWCCPVLGCRSRSF
jgi:hypothetical protein